MEYSNDTIQEEDAVEAPAIPQVEVTEDEVTITVPKRIPNQEALEALAENLDDDEFGVLCNVLRSRRWTDDEFEDRVKVLRPNHPYFQDEE